MRIANRNMFASGEASLNPGYGPLLDRIGAALQDEPGQVVVVGHTDNQPIRTARFPSNWQLSQRGPRRSARLIAAKLSDAGRLQAEGHADNEPIASNATAEGRQQNRRTDIVLIKPPAPPVKAEPMKKIASFLLSAWLLSAIGRAAACLLVWFFGPLLAFGARHPLETGCRGSW